MSTISGYPARSFDPSQKFLVLDPSTQTTALVLGSDLVSYITPSLDVVRTNTTRAAALNEDYEIGTFVQTAGGAAIDDGGNGMYLVVAAGDGDYAMLNGNELLLLPFGTLVGSDLDGALVTDDGVQVTIQSAIAKREVHFTSLAALLASTCTYDYVTVDAANEGGTTGRMELYNNGTTGTPTTNGNRFSALAAGTFFNAAGIGYGFHEDMIIRPEHFGAVGDGDRNGGGTNDYTALNLWLTRARDNGGNYAANGKKVYRSDSPLTCLSNTTTRRTYILDFAGAEIDFSNYAMTSGDMFAYGATSQANSHDDEIDNIRNLIIRGPEPAIGATPATSVVGLSLEYALNLHAQNIAVISCYEGIKTNFVFDLQADNLRTQGCYVGLRIDDTSTYALWNNFKAVNNRYGIVAKPSTSGAIIANQTFVNARLEGNDVGCAIDGGTNASFGVRSLTFINTYAENNTYDLFREGLQWTIADPQTRNAASSGYVVNTTILGGDWSGMTWGASCAPIAWPSAIGTVLGGEYRIPAAMSNCVNYPGKSTFQQLIDLTSGLGQNMQPTSMPGYGVVVIRGSDGLLTISNNLISSTSRTGVGVYEINFREAFTGSTDYAVGATCDDGYVEIDTASCTASKLVLNCFSNAAAAIDPARVRVMIHGVLT